MICPTDRIELAPVPSPDGSITTAGCGPCSGRFVPAQLMAEVEAAIGEPLGFEVRAEHLDYYCPACNGDMAAGAFTRFPTFVLLRCSTCGGLWLHQDNLQQVLDARQKAPTLQGRFEVGAEFMVGRHSTLYHALDRSTGSPVVLRKLHDATPEAREQLLREGQILQRLDHRNIPRVLQTIEDPGGAPPGTPQGSRQIYLVLEDFGGITLEGFLAEIGEPGGAQLLERFLDQFLSVLRYLHAQDPPIVHRDLRPDSILLTDHGVLKVAEFSLARMRENARDAQQTVFRQMGSPAYAAPEQLAGGSSRPGNDIYAVGAILHYLATGLEPPSSIGLYRKEETMQPLSSQRPDLPHELVATISAMMNPDPKTRPQTVEAVEQVRAGLGTAPRPLQRPSMLRMPVAVAASAPSTGRLREEDAPPPPPEPNGKPAEAVVIEFDAPPVSVQETPPQPEIEPTPPPREVRPEEPPSPGKASFFSGLFGLGRKKGGGRGPSQPVVTEADLQKFEQLDLATHKLDREAARLLPETVSRSIQGVCVGRRSANELTVAVKDPTQVHIYDHVSFATNGRYNAFLVRADAMMIDLAHEFVYKIPHFYEALPWLEWLDRKKLEAETLDVKGASTVITFGADDITSPVIEAVDRIVKEAISIGASDIHLESFEKEMLVRYRIDGVLHEISKFEPKEASAMVKRLKIMANMDIAQDRITQGGRISVSVAGRELDLRVSIVPVPAGESVVCRLLKKGAFDLTLADLGFSKRDEDRYLKVLSQPYGMILVSGPTGSGKSTTLYASLKEIARPDRKLLTVEDPIEYQMPLITQVQVNMSPREDEKKVTFARTLREFLRQDPDVILVGEIRDQETAAISVQAALTGHLLLSTIHTNDSIGIFARLRDMGVEPFLIASTMVGGLAQRLGRKICVNCKTEEPVPEPYKEMFEKEGLAPDHLYRGAGCLTCHGTGYKGRMAIYEILEITPDVRELVTRKAHDDEIKGVAQQHGFRTLLQDGLTKVVEGKVTLDEVQRVCMTL